MSIVSTLTGNKANQAGAQPFQSLDATMNSAAGGDFARLLSQPTTPSETNPMQRAKQPDKLKETFNEFVGNVVFGQMLASMRKTVGKAPYMHGGRGEEVFQNQLDQELTKQLTTASADQFAGPMFELFQLQRAN